MDAEGGIRAGQGAGLESRGGGGGQVDPYLFVPGSSYHISFKSSLPPTLNSASARRSSSSLICSLDMSSM